MSLVNIGSINDQMSINKLRFFWKIKGFSLLKVKRGQKITSPTFDYLGNTWYLGLYPHGQDAESENHLSMFLCCHKRVNYRLPVCFKISIITNDNHIIHEQEIERDFKGLTIGYGNPKYLSRKILFDNKQVNLPNDNLTICCKIKNPEIQISKDVIKIPESEHGANLKRKFRNQEFGDVTFNIDGSKIKACKVILAAQSDVFDAMFKHKDMKENKKNEVNIVDFSLRVFEKMLDFIYTGDTPDYDNDTEDLLKLADKYHLERLKCFCEKELYEKISAENAVELLILADTYSAAQLKEKSLEYIATHLTNVLKSKDFKNIVTFNPQLAVELIQEIDNQRTTKEK